MTKLSGVAVQVKDTKLDKIESFNSITAAAGVLKVSRTAVNKVIGTDKLLKNR